MVCEALVHGECWTVTGDSEGAHPPCLPTDSGVVAKCLLRAFLPAHRPPSPPSSSVRALFINWVLIFSFFF